MSARVRAVLIGRLVRSVYRNCEQEKKHDVSEWNSPKDRRNMCLEKNSP